MGVFQRLRDMTAASINEWLDKVENPVALLNQYLRDMEEEIAEAEVTVAKQMAHERKLAEQVKDLERLMAEREAQAEQALREGKEETARQWLADRLHLQQRMTEVQTLHSQARAQSEELAHLLHERKETFYRMRNKRNELAARSFMAQTQKQMSQSGFSGVLGRGNAAQGFQRVEERILQMEIEAGLMRGSAGPGMADPGTERRIDEEMERLRGKLGLK
ncbi:PspA/IM30 family protein [Kyrpidia tusciae]|uniref:Phage shock protein A, PspA n=1 Tax=Kyrpidia tusciae (strain DSM 2912 / NBRC 15312 / T2) TaxID=562970 RepID=D5WY46_KYRT2|nr:PspA/IM30 family protein [Kyrpidia tusciae]ADG06105.1 phage shock protein A, PspA [Kyrpidia tusciae DSM 2912]